MNEIKVLIVEDSKLMQQLLSNILSSDPEIKVVGVADDPLIARDLIKKTHPDVLTLDIMLPHMDGITFLKNLMRLHPLPVVMVSTLTQSDSAIALEALANGAVDYLLKPTQEELDDITNFNNNLIAAVKTAATANVVKSLLKPEIIDQKLKSVIYETNLLKNDLIVIGASTGGIEAVETILLQLPQVFPPIMIVQHIKKEFGSAFANRIKKLYGLSVIQPSENTQILPGNIYIAPCESHMIVEKVGKQYIASLTVSESVNGHQPSIDVLFKSAALASKQHTIGILLTGMGSDGAEGLKAIHDAGGTTMVQDKESSVVWGMPSAAIKLHAVDEVVPLNKIPQAILKIIDSRMLKPTTA